MAIGHMLSVKVKENDAKQRTIGQGEKILGFNLRNVTK